MMECSQVTELLPWLANGSLAPEEADSVARHLRECAACRRELSETGAAFGLFGEALGGRGGEHLPVATLVEMAFEGAVEPASRAAAESHLEGCSSCAEQLELVRGSRRALTEIEEEERTAAAGQAPAAEPGGRVVTFPAPGRAAGAAPWRRAAIAASIAALVSTVGWLSTWQGSAGPERVASNFRGDAVEPAGGRDEDSGQLSLRDRLAAAAGPELNVPIVRAEPRDRAAAGGEAVSRVPLGADGVVLVLSSRLDGEASLTCRLEAADGSEVWTRQGLERRPEGGYTLRFSTDRLDGGRYTLRLLGADGAELESYLLSID